MKSGTAYPTHIAIVMDGNGRWAKNQSLPRIEGHRQGVHSVRAVVSGCLEYHIPILTLFAFSSENWRRPTAEVSFLFTLLLNVLEQEITELHQRGVKLVVIGDRSVLNSSLQTAILKAETLTRNNSHLQLNLAINFGGQWDIFQAAKKMAEQIVDGRKTLEQLTIADFASGLSLADVPAPDLFIRTSDIRRISNFLLWDLAYTEFYFTAVMWPEFRKEHLKEAIDDFSMRERRFGYTGEQLQEGIAS